MTDKRPMSKSKIITLDSLSLSNILNEDSELIPLMTPEDEEIINKEDIPEVLPILPLRNTVLFPGVVIPITAGRDKSIQLINDANKRYQNLNIAKVVGIEARGFVFAAMLAHQLKAGFVPIRKAKKRVT